MDKTLGTPHSTPHLLGHSQANSDGVPSHSPGWENGYTGYGRELELNYGDRARDDNVESGWELG